MSSSEAARWLTSSSAGPLLAVSPHLDDLVFSACAPVLARPLEVWTVFAGAPEPPTVTDWDRGCGFRDSTDALTRRRREDTAAFEGTRATVRHLPHLDGPYTDPVRRQADLAEFRTDLERWIDQHPGGTVLAPACAGVRVPPGVWERFRRARGLVAPAAPAPGVEAVEDPVGRTVTPPVRQVTSAVKAGLRRLMHADYQRRRAAAQRRGLAVNNDHVAVRDAVLEAAWRRPATSVVLYEDLPYLWSQSADAEVQELRRRGLEPVEFSLPVDVDEKFRRIQAYESQVDVMDPVHRRLSRAGSLPPAERYWLLSSTRA
ncbi:hypothetical protein ACPCG0_10595 [Propionibacteriaceae bacterium Y1923]